MKSEKKTTGRRKRPYFYTFIQFKYKFIIIFQIIKAFFFQIISALEIFLKSLAFKLSLNFNIRCGKKTDFYLNN